MNATLRTLILEDRPADAELMLRELRRAGYDPEWMRVETEPDYLAQLDQGWEIILADYHLPQYDGLRALKSLMARRLDIPFILVSATVGEEIAVAAINAGASDYVMKDGLARLAPAVARGLREVAEHRQRRQAEEAVRRLATAVDQAAEAIMITDLSSTIQYVNPAFERITGYTNAEAIGHTPRLLKSGQQDVAFYRRLWHTISAGEVWSGRFSNRRKDGVLYDEECTISPVRDDQGLIANFIAVKQDVTARVRVEEALAKSEAKYRTLFESSRDAIMTLFPPDWNFTSANSATIELFGAKDEKEFTSLGPGGYSPERQPDGEFSSVASQRMIATAVEQGSHYFEWTHQRITGEIFPATVLLTRVELDGKTGLQATVRDSTEREAAEAEREMLQRQFLQAQKMESVGRLAGGVAHDFNNMLTVILGHVELALMRVDPSDSLRADLEEIRQAASRSADLTRQLLAFARRQAIAPRVLDLNDAVGGMTAMLRRLIGEDIHLTWKPGPNLWPVKIDPAQVDQILANLSVNARDAIAGAGSIFIQIDNVMLDSAAASSRPGVVAGAQVRLTVRDDGCGMDDVTLGHVFEPFFTTKAVGLGTGLGLATVYGIVKQNGGWIDVSSDVGKGTTVEIYLPRAEKDVAAATGGQTAATAKRGSETVLLVEDEEAILNLSKAMLEHLGYTVLAARHPQEALRLVQASPDRIDLVITDVVMPGLNGQELVERIAVLKPGVRCMFMSGYTADVIANRGVLADGVQFIQKPFSLTDLALKVRYVLDQA